MTSQELIARQMRIVNARRKTYKQVAAVESVEESDSPAMSAAERIAKQAKLVNQRRQASNNATGNAAPVEVNDSAAEAKRITADRIAKQKLKLSARTTGGHANISQPDLQLEAMMREYAAFAAKVNAMAMEMKSTATVDAVEEKAEPLVNGISTEEGSVVMKKTQRAKKKVDEVAAEGKTAE